MRKKPVPVSLIITPSTVPKIAILDADMVMAKKIVKKKKHCQVVNVLKESVGASTIIRHIMDLEVNLIIGKLLASAPTIKNSSQKIFLKTKLLSSTTTL